MITITEKIHEAIKYATKDHGYGLVESTWGSHAEKCLCPLGCALLAGGMTIVEDWRKNRDNASRLLGVDDKWIEHFISGFDGNDPRHHQINPTYIDAFALGSEFRAEYRSEWEKTVLKYRAKV